MRAHDSLTPAATGAPDVTRRVALGSIFHLSAQLVLMGCGYLVSVVLARALGPAGFGAYGVVYSFLLAVELIGRLGIPQAAGKLVAEQRDTDHAIEATGLNLSFLVYLALFAGVWLAAPPRQWESSCWCRPARAWRPPLWSTSRPRPWR
jgi:O-antigen/teichoic acid export membrane protein